MLRNSSFILGFVLLVICFAFVQDDTKTIVHAYDFSAVDKLGNIYLIKNDEIEKYKDGVASKRYSRKGFGNITAVDASNALRILLFYKNANKIVFLDNQLSEKSEVIDLFKLQTINAKVVCNSSNNQFWVFDVNNAELIKVGSDLTIASRTGNLNNQMEDAISPSMLKEINNLVYLVDVKLGIFVFDYFGTLIKKIPLLDVQHFEVVNDAIYYANTKKEIWQYDMQSFDSKKIEACIDCQRIYYDTPYIVLEKKDTLIYKLSKQ